MQNLRWLEASSLDVFPPYDIMETGLPFTADWTVSSTIWHIVLPHASPQECQWQSSERTFRLLSSLPALSLPIWPPITPSVPQSLFSSSWVLPLMMKGWSEGYQASKHVHGGYVGMVKLLYLCMSVQHFWPPWVWVWPLGCTLQSLSLPSPPVWAFLLQPFKRALLIAMW